MLCYFKSIREGPFLVQAFSRHFFICAFVFVESFLGFWCLQSRFRSYYYYLASSQPAFLQNTWSPPAFKRFLARAWRRVVCLTVNIVLRAGWDTMGSSIHQHVRALLREITHNFGKSIFLRAAVLNILIYFLISQEPDSVPVSQSVSSASKSSKSRTCNVLFEVLLAKQGDSQLYPRCHVSQSLSLKDTTACGRGHDPLRRHRGNGALFRQSEESYPRFH